MSARHTRDRGLLPSSVAFAAAPTAALSSSLNGIRAGMRASVGLPPQPQPEANLATGGKRRRASDDRLAGLVLAALDGAGRSDG